VTTETEKVVLELLRCMRGTLDRIEMDLSDVRVRVSTIEHHLGQQQIQLAALNARMDRFDERLSRIERRMELVDA
jgi:predicted  nucleic acid-binding Zn-ribbon protein